MGRGREKIRRNNGKAERIDESDAGSDGGLAEDRRRE